MVVILLQLIGLIILLIGIFDTKTLALLENPAIYLQAIEAENVYTTWIGRVGTALFLLGSAFAISQALYYRKGRLPNQGLLITIAWVGVYIPPIISGMLSETGRLNYKIFFFPLFLIITYMSPRFEIREKASKLVFILLVFIYVSLFGMILRLNWAYAEYSGSWIGIPIRLFGTESHPNGLGAIALASLILMRFLRKKSIWLAIHKLATIIVIILAQSKTIWFAWLFLWLVERVVKKSSIKERLLKRIAVSMVFSLFLVTGALLFMQHSMINPMFNTLWDRVNVWEITLQTWLKNPIFGYGPNIWDFEFRQMYNYLWAGHAHNQLIQILGESGIVGLLSLLIFYLVLSNESSKYAGATNLVTYEFMVLILYRSFTEAPLRNYTIDSGFLINAIFFVIMINSELLQGKSPFPKRIVSDKPERCER